MHIDVLVYINYPSIFFSVCSFSIPNLCVRVTVERLLEWRRAALCVWSWTFQRKVRQHTLKNTKRLFMIQGNTIQLNSTQYRTAVRRTIILHNTALHLYPLKTCCNVLLLYCFYCRHGCCWIFCARQLTSLIHTSWFLQFDSLQLFTDMIVIIVSIMFIMKFFEYLFEIWMMF